MTVHFRVVLSHAFLAILFLPTSGAYAQDRCAKAQSGIESTICGDSNLKQLDAKLNHVYSLARQSVSDKNGLRSKQLNWLRMVRDRCETKECLTRIYQERIAELVDIFVLSVQISETPMSDGEAEKTCVALAGLADREQLAKLAIPGRDQGMLDASVIESGWGFSQEEKEQLKARDPWSNEPSTIYKLRLTSKGNPTRFASFFIGGSCASYKVSNISYLSNSEGDDVESDDVGIDEVSDPDEIIRWAYWGGGDYPIFYHGRNYMITADLANKNHINMASWIKPDGKIRPLCLFSREITKMKVVSAKNPELCSKIANDSLEPLSWKPITEDLPFTPSQVYRDEFVTRYSKYADEVSLLSIDIDGDGKPENIGKFVYYSGAGCGSTDIWLSIFAKDFETIVNNTLSSQFEKLRSGSMDIYKVKGRYYIAATQNDADAGVVQISNGETEQLCEFKYLMKTTISHRFKIDP
ncbi:MAG: lysozyme inhibitor LprI family protein [Methylobacillus sp.]|jgi:uncharacterized protein|nr:lysozyme inhibitor LprI family protein [Methylobacillus sp.]